MTSRCTCSTRTPPRSGRAVEFRTRTSTACSLTTTVRMSHELLPSASAAEYLEGTATGEWACHHRIHCVLRRLPLHLDCGRVDPLPAGNHLQQHWHEPNRTRQT